MTTFHGSTEFNDMENGKFEIGVDEGDDKYEELQTQKVIKKIVRPIKVLLPVQIKGC
jgi:hypothetical protein